MKVSERRYQGVDLPEAVDDFRLACVSRALDDREIALRQQSRVFFQISGAGHEALLLGLARSLRPGYDWFELYYRDRALCLALGVTPYEMFLQAFGSSEDPASAGRQMPSHWGSRRLNLISKSSCTGTQFLHAVGAAEAGWRRSVIPELASQGGFEKDEIVEFLCSELAGQPSE